MNAISRLAAALALLAGTSAAVVAQQLPGTPEQPSNIPHRASVCGDGFWSADVNGDGVISPEDRPYNSMSREFDTNNDGLVSEAEFSSGCAENLLEREDRDRGGI